jgi:hypothetical protein
VISSIEKSTSEGKMMDGLGEGTTGAFELAETDVKTGQDGGIRCPDCGVIGLTH